MGNTHNQSKGSADLTAAIKGCPMFFHANHSANIRVSNDKRTAKRIESFCKGICFGSRPVAINERVYIKFAEVSTSWSGVLRFGFTSNDPAEIDSSNLPRYACPDLTNRPGFWAKALPERMAEQGNILFFQVTRQGEVLFGLNEVEKGQFFTGLPANVPLWPVVDIYGNTTIMEFVDGKQLSNITLDEALLTQYGGAPASPSLSTVIPPPPSPAVQPFPPPAAGGAASSQTAKPYPLMPEHAGVMSPSSHAALSRAHSVHSSAALQNNPNLSITHYASMSFRPLPFNSSLHGRNVNLSADRNVAVRMLEEYCNGYVFTPRPFQCGERIVIQVLSVDKSYGGGIAFGMTACDPKTLRPDDLPDDSDLLLDRPEYWVVNKDVCTNAEVRDELSFHLTIEGEVRYGRNGHHITTLMHIDKTLPMWAFFDIYGSTQKIKCLGLANLERGPTVPARHGSFLSAVHSPHSLAARNNQSTPNLPSGVHTDFTPPPRPPPPRTSPGSASVRSSPGGSPRLESSGRSLATPPVLPPKQRTPTGTPATIQESNSGWCSSVGGNSGVGGNVSISGSGGGGGNINSPVSSPSMSLPPPLIPIPTELAPPIPKQPQSYSTSSKPSPPKPAIPPRSIDKQKPPPVPSRSSTNTPIPSSSEQPHEEDDNANNECCVCWENGRDCVVYTCGHMCMCYSCALDIKDNQDGLCPMCRREIKDIIKIYKS